MAFYRAPTLRWALCTGSVLEAFSSTNALSSHKDNARRVLLPCPFPAEEVEAEILGSWSIIHVELVSSMTRTPTCV